MKVQKESVCQSKIKTAVTALTVFFVSGIFTIILLIVITSCGIKNSFDGLESLQIALPQWPPDSGCKELYPPLNYWIVNIKGEGICTEFSVEASVKLIELEVVKNKPLCVTASPVTKIAKESESALCNFFYPGGVIYPYGKNSQNQLELTWEQGTLAFLMNQLFEKGYKSGYSQEEITEYISSFNWNKLKEAFEKKQNQENESFYNPWFLDLEALLNAIGHKDFYWQLYNMKGVFTVNLESFLMENSSFVLSPYIPENEVIYNYKRICLKKDCPGLFSIFNIYGILFNGNSEKNLSLEFIFLPIYIEGI